MFLVENGLGNTISRSVGRHWVEKWSETRENDLQISILQLFTQKSISHDGKREKIRTVQLRARLVE